MGLPTFNHVRNSVVTLHRGPGKCTLGRGAGAAAFRTRGGGVVRDGSRPLPCPLTLINWSASMPKNHLSESDTDLVFSTARLLSAPAV